MSTLRTTTLKHGSSTIDNIVFDNQGRSTFGGNALFVNAQNQRVGVNTTSPTVALDVDGAINATGNVVFSGQLTLTGDLAVDTNTLFVDASTNYVGIGTASPQRRLHIEGTGANDSRLRCTRSGVDGEFGIASNNIVINALGSDGTNGGIDFYTGGDRKLTLTPTGRLGINTATPLQTLEVTGTGAVIRVNNTSSGANVWGEFSNPGGNDSQALVFTARGGASSYGGFSFNSTDGSGTNTVMVARASGSVGIGTTNPQDGRAPLHLHTGNSTTNIHLTNDTSGQSSSDGFTVFMEGVTSAGLWYRENGDLRFATNNSEKVRIDSPTGRLLVGLNTTPPDIEGITPKLVCSSSGTADSDLGLYCYRNAGGSGRDLIASRIHFARSRSGVNGTLGGIVNVTEILGQMRFAGDDGAKFVTAAEITAKVDGTPGLDDMPGSLLFATTPAGDDAPIERMRISSTGKIGFSANLANVNFYNAIPITGGASGSYAYYASGSIQSDVTGTAYLYATGAKTAAASFTLNRINHFTANQETIGAGSTVTSQIGFTAAASLTGATNNYGFYSDIAASSGRWNFYANGDALNYFAGSVLFGTTNAGGITTGSVNAKSIDGATGQLYSSRTATTSVNHVVFYNGNGLAGSISTNGSATVYSTSSDYRLKENVVPITGAADRIKALKPCRFNFIVDATKTVDGFIAHEAQEVVPESVTGEKDGEEMQAIDTSKLVPLLTAALQEALERIKVLEQRVLE